MKKYKLLDSGIEINRELEEYEKTHICHRVADILRKKYPYLPCNYLQIITELYNTKMYLVKDANKVSLVNYIYQNKSIYFSEEKDLKKVDETVIHECLHKLQDKRSKNGRRRGTDCAQCVFRVRCAGTGGNTRQCNGN